MKHYQRALELIELAQALHERARTAQDDALRIELLDRAERLADEARQLAAVPVRWLGMGRAGWMRLQWAVGVGNAFGVFFHLARGALAAAAVSALCVLIVARWSLPSPTRKGKRNGT